jgi:hypothetical protein
MHSIDPIATGQRATTSPVGRRASGPAGVMLDQPDVTGSSTADLDIARGTERAPRARCSGGRIEHTDRSKAHAVRRPVHIVTLHNGEGSGLVRPAVSATTVRRPASGHGRVRIRRGSRGDEPRRSVPGDVLLAAMTWLGRFGAAGVTWPGESGASEPARRVAGRVEGRAFRAS